MKFKTFLMLAFATLSVAILGVTFSGCGTRTDTKSNDVDTTHYELTGETGIEKDPEITFDEEKNFDGKHYVIGIHRAPADSMPQVIDSNDVPFLDNQVDVVVKANGAVIFKHSFTKKNFDIEGSKLPLEKLVLAGMAFNDINGSGIHFNAQLNSPGSEEGGSNFKISFPLNGGSPKIVAEELSEDLSGDMAVEE